MKTALISTIVQSDKQKPRLEALFLFEYFFTGCNLVGSSSRR